MPRQPMRSRTQDPEVRRAQILDEAIRTIGARGYNGFVLLELANRCGLTNGGLLYHFGSKEQLLLAVLEARDNQLTEEMIAALGPKMQEARSGAAPLGDVLEVFRGMVQRVQSQPELARLYAVLQAESLDPSHPAHGYFVAREAMALGGFAELLGPLVADPLSAARHLHALMDGLVLQWLRAAQGFDIVAAWDRAVADLGWRERDKQGEGAT